MDAPVSGVVQGRPKTLPEAKQWLRDKLAARDLSHKGSQKREQEYLDRTISKAQMRVRESVSALPPTLEATAANNSRERNRAQGV